MLLRQHALEWLVSHQDVQVVHDELRRQFDPWCASSTSLSRVFSIDVVADAPASRSSPAGCGGPGALNLYTNAANAAAFTDLTGPKTMSNGWRTDGGCVADSSSNRVLNGAYTGASPAFTLLAVRSRAAADRRVHWLCSLELNDSGVVCLLLRRPRLHHGRDAVRFGPSLDNTCFFACTLASDSALFPSKGVLLRQRRRPLDDVLVQQLLHALWRQLDPNLRRTVRLSCRFLIPVSNIS